MTSMTDWLEQLGLANYADLFAAHEIDFDALQLLTDADLTVLGVPMGPRRKILHAIAEHAAANLPLGSSGESSSSLPSLTDDVLSEHRQLSVMFVDLVGWSELAERVEAERLPHLIRRYHEVCADAILRHEGYIAQYLGDGLLVYFGYPRAHENDAERAVRVGLEIVDAIRLLNEELDVDDLPELSVRVGIHTGLTIVGEIGGQGRHEQLALGSTPNIAARIQSIAEPNTVFIGAPTRALIARHFRCADLGAVALKGARHAMHIYHVLGPRSWGTRFEAARRGRLTPLVGREREIGMLMDCWQLVREGIGQIMCVAGEAGIGKSRLLDVLRERLRSETPTGVVLQCLPHYTNSPLHPIVEHSEHALGFTPEDTPASKLDKIEGLLIQLYGRPVEDVKLMAALLGVPFEERHGPLQLAPKKHRGETLRMLADVTEAAARRNPLLLIVEDAHWADPSTIEMLTAVARRAQSTPLFLILTHRPEFANSAFLEAGATLLVLPRLTTAQSSTIVARLNRDGILGPAMIEQIVAHSDGVPLFVEEITKAVLESVDDGEAAARKGAIPIPATLRDSLMARLDRVPGGKLIAQIGAIIGREFSYRLLASVAREFKVDVKGALKGLSDAGLVLAQQSGSDVVYQFKHALVQDVAEDSLLKSARRALHSRCAHTLEAQFSALRETRPELLAHHYTEAGEPERAVPYWILAGKHAAARLAHVEALRHFEAATELLQQCDDTTERTRTELDLRAAMGAVLVTVKGYSAVEVEQNYTRARELCAIVSDPRLEGSVLRGQTQLLLLRARYQEARELASLLLRLGEREGNVAQQVDGHMMLGLISIYDGQMQAAVEQLERGLNQLDPEGHRNYGTSNGVDLGIGCLAYHARALWFLGYPDAALRSAHEALALAAHPAVWLGAAQAMAMCALLHQTRDDIEDTFTFAERTAAHAREHGIPYWEAVSEILIGWVDARTGNAGRGVARIERGWSQYCATSARLGTSWAMATLASAQHRAGDREAAMRSIDAAIAHIEETGELYFAPEVWRVRGTLLVDRAPLEAEACYEKAAQLADSMGLRSWTLRTAISLARLWQSQGKMLEAMHMLERAFAPFTEGFEASDLQEAARLLAELQTLALGQLPRVIH